jgi:hypothetical protein
MQNCSNVADCKTTAISDDVMDFLVHDIKVGSLYIMIDDIDYLVSEMKQKNAKKKQLISDREAIEKKLEILNELSFSNDESIGISELSCKKSCIQKQINIYDSDLAKHIIEIMQLKASVESFINADPENYHLYEEARARLHSV